MKCKRCGCVCEPDTTYELGVREYHRGGATWVNLIDLDVCELCASVIGESLEWWCEEAYRNYAVTTNELADSLRELHDKAAALLARLGK